MTSWSDQEVRVDGVSLTNFAHGISLRTGLDALPPKRGENVKIAYYIGQRWRSKQVDSVVRTLTMWVDGRTADGNYAPTTQQRVGQLNANIDELMVLFGKTVSQLAIERDVLDAGGGLTTWYGLCEVVDTVVPQWDEDWNEHCFLSVDLLFADPFWYSSPQTAVVTL